MYSGIQIRRKILTRNDFKWKQMKRLKIFPEQQVIRQVTYAGERLVFWVLIYKEIYHTTPKEF